MNLILVLLYNIQQKERLKKIDNSQLVSDQRLNDAYHNKD